MQKWLEKEKELRGKGIADKQIEETVAFLRQKGIDTVWDDIYRQTPACGKRSRTRC
jgi:predicted GNAT family acetyltransferase